MTDEPQSSPARKSFWQRRVVGLLVAQLKQGTAPEKIALTVALGFTLGIFPILGSTTALCAVAALCFKLNQPIIQLVNYIFSAAQLALILVFVRFGEWITQSERVPFSIPELMRKFQASPKKFMQEFGMTGVHGIIGWTVVAPILIPVIYYSVLPPLKRLSRKTYSSHAG